MAQSKRSIVVALLVLVALSACGRATAAKDDEPAPARVERVKGSDIRRVSLTPRAVERLGVTTVPVSTGPGGGTVVPYAAVLYDPSGRTWVYESIGPRTYQRAHITVDRIDGDQAYLSASPPPGTAVVSVGAAEVYGTEFFSEHE